MASELILILADFSRLAQSAPDGVAPPPRRRGPAKGAHPADDAEPSAE